MINSACKSLLITTHEYILQYAPKYKTEKQIRTSHHNIDTIILGMETPGKTQMGKPMQQSDIDFIMRRYGTLQSLQIHPNLANATTRLGLNNAFKIFTDNHT